MGKSFKDVSILILTVLILFIGINSAGAEGRWKCIGGTVDGIVYFDTQTVRRESPTIIFAWIKTAFYNPTKDGWKTTIISEKFDTSRRLWAMDNLVIYDINNRCIASYNYGYKPAYSISPGSQQETVMRHVNEYLNSY
jgi:hypothetical protein